MYSAAFNHFYRFATNLHQTGLPSIRLMDAVMERPEQKQPYSISRWERNQILVDQAIQSAGYCCEHKREHRTFLSQSTHHMYMEGHHIIPLKLQGTFPCSLDIYANIVSLCPTCHRLLHYGIFNDKKPVVDVIFSNRQDRLATCGVKLSDSEIMEFYQ